MIVDVVVLAVLLVSAIIAFARGFIREVLTILGVVGGIAAAYTGGPYAAVYAREWLGVQEGVEPERLFGAVPYTLVADALAYGGIFILVVIMLSIVSHVLAESVKSLGLGAIDRSFGVVFGIARGVLLLGLLYLPVYLLVDQETKAKWFEGSRTFFYLEQTSAAMEKYLPESAKKKAGEEFKKLQDANSTREKLEEIKLLPGEDTERPVEAPPAEATPQGKTGGYNEDFRQKMDQFIDQKTQKANE